MSIIKNLFIPCVEADILADNIIESFYMNDIATVSKVILIPFTREEKLYYKAYLEIHEWHETESGYNFVKRLKNPSLEARIVHYDDSWWAVRIDNKPWLTKVENGTTYINWLVVDEPAPIIPEPKEAVVDPDWTEIECGLYEMDLYRNIEYELCL
jgi:hypothetical protein